MIGPDVPFFSVPPSRVPASLFPVSYHENIQETKVGCLRGRPECSSSTRKAKAAEARPLQTHYPNQKVLGHHIQFRNKWLINPLRKDDYAFFLKPVDPKLVPGYGDVIQQPMDLGTMATKVSRGKYRSLEDFAVGETLPSSLQSRSRDAHDQNDFRLVTSNAKLFNPPGSIYHTEAERIEAWGLDRITKAAATVIEYETDWNVEIEGDDHLSNAPEEEGEDTPEPEPTESRAQSILSNSQPHPLPGRRSARAAATANTAPPVATTSKVPKSVSETLQSDGGLPGAKDGLGKFPPGSDMARLMLALKLKGSHPFIYPRMILSSFLHGRF